MNDFKTKRDRLKKDCCDCDKWCDVAISLSLIIILTILVLEGFGITDRLIGN